MLWIPLVILAAVCAVSAVLFYLEGSYIAAGAAAMSIICVAVLCVMVAIVDRNVTRYVTGIDRDILKTNREEFWDYPEPIVIADADRTIIWYNRCFERDIFGDDRVYGIKLSELVGENNAAKMFLDGGTTVKILDRHYRVTAQEGISGLLVISFVDISSHVALE